MTDINTELFRRTSPVKKVEVINNLTQAELSKVSEETILRIVKETGRKTAKSRNYEFYVNPIRRNVNRLNSELEVIWLYKRKLSFVVYIQYDDTDSSLLVPFNDFFKKGDFRGTIKRDDRYGNPQTHYYVYDENDKTEVMRSFCLEYINTKYKSKLNTNN